MPDTPLAGTPLTRDERPGTTPMTLNRFPRAIAALLLAAGLPGAHAQRMSAAPDCIVLSGGTGAAFADAKVDGTWLSVNRQVTDLLLEDLRENGYAVRKIFTEAADRDAKPNKALAATAASGCAHVLQVSHRVGDDADGPFFSFDISLLRFVRADGGPPVPGSQTTAVSDFAKNYRHPRTVDELEKFHTGTFANEVFRDLLASHAIDADFAPDPDSTIVHKTYDRLAAANQVKETHVRHILVDDQAKARRAIARIQAGESFADVARQMSSDTGSAAAGGDLGWAKSTTYVPEFARAVEAFQPKGLDPDPVHSSFGWHVIEVLEARPAPFPAFDDVKLGIALALKQRHAEALKAKP